jgi:hypothetical protein
MLGIQRVGAACHLHPVELKRVRAGLGDDLLATVVVGQNLLKHLAQGI